MVLQPPCRTQRAAPAGARRIAVCKQQALSRYTAEAEQPRRGERLRLRRELIAETIALPLVLATVQSSAAQEAPADVPPGFDPAPCRRLGDAFNCSGFPSQAAAQSVLQADPRYANRLDADRDGIARQRN